MYHYMAKVFIKAISSPYSRIELIDEFPPIFQRRDTNKARLERASAAVSLPDLAYPLSPIRIIKSDTSKLGTPLA